MTAKHKLFGRARVWRFIAVALYSFFLAVTAIPQIAHAETKSLDQRAKAFQAARALLACSSTGFVGNIFGPDRSKKELNDGGLFRSGADGGIPGKSEPTGYLIDGEDGLAECSDAADIKDIFTDLGITDIAQFLTDAGVVKVNGDFSGYDYTDKTNEERGLAIAKKIGKDFGVNVSNAVMSDNDMKYYTLWKAFKARCATGSPSSSGITVQEVDLTTGVKKSPADKYVLELEDGDIVNVGYGPQKDGKMQCTTIVSALNSTADAFAKSQAALYAKDPAAAAASSDTSTPERELDFQCDGSWNPLTWFMCPLVNAFAETVNKLDGEIIRMLTINTDKYFDDSCSDASCATAQGFKKVWSNMRTLSVALLVIAGLVMVIGTAIGDGIFDAYTVKKLFPRILIAILGISVSWPLLIFVINIFNTLGIGIRGLIQAPFQDLFNNVVSIGGGQLSLGFLGVVGLGLSLGILGLLSFVATAFLAVAIAFITLIVREMLVVLLVITAPIAIAFFILPNTQKAGKLWWETLEKALIAFPIISAFIAIGRVFALIFSQPENGTSSSGTIKGFIAFIAYFAPYFLIPQAFKMAGGALGNLSGMVNDRGRGAFDRLRNFRQERSKDRIKGFRSGGIYDKSTKRGWFGNKIGGAIFNADEQLPYYLGRVGMKDGAPSRRNPFGKQSARLGSSIEHAVLDETQKLSQELQGAGLNAEALAAISGVYGNLDEATQERLRNAKSERVRNGTATSIEDFQELASIMSSSTSETERLAGNMLMGSAGRLGTLHRDRDLGYANVQAAAMLERSRQGFASGEEIAEIANKVSHGGKHTGTAQALATRAQLLGQAQRPDLKAGYGVLFDESTGQFYSGITGNAAVATDPDNPYEHTNQIRQVRSAARAKELFKTLKQQDIMGAKANLVKELHPGIVALAKETTVNGEGQTVPTEEARAAMDTIMQNISVYAGNDAKAKIEWRRIAAEVDPSIIERSQQADQYRAAQEAAAGGGGGGGGTPGSAGPPTYTPPGQ